MGRRRFIRSAASGTVIVALGAYFLLDDDLTREARAQTRDDGRPRVPPGQRVIRALKPMGGEPGDPNPGHLKLRIHGEVENPFVLSFSELLRLPQVDKAVDVHCVTGWTALDQRCRGVSIKALSERARVKGSARYVIFEAAHGYTSNMPLKEALSPSSLVAHRLNGQDLPRAHGGPLRAVVPDLYFWKSAKWLTGIRFASRDEPGYWEVRGYNNHGDPWREQRYS